MKSLKNKKMLVLIAFVLVLLTYSAFHYKWFDNTMVYKASEQPATPTQDEKRLEEIRNRETVKKQQELIVQETYFLEEKARIQTEKDTAIKQYDSQIGIIETQLEGVRASKLSFQ